MNVQQPFLIPWMGLSSTQQQAMAAAQQIAQLNNGAQPPQNTAQPAGQQAAAAGQPGAPAQPPTALHPQQLLQKVVTAGAVPSSAHAAQQAQAQAQAQAVQVNAAAQTGALPLAQLTALQQQYHQALLLAASGQTVASLPALASAVAQQQQAQAQAQVVQAQAQAQQQQAPGAGQQQGNAAAAQLYAQSVAVSCPSANVLTAGPVNSPAAAGVPHSLLGVNGLLTPPNAVGSVGPVNVTAGNAGHQMVPPAATLPQHFLTAAPQYSSAVQKILIPGSKVRKSKEQQHLFTFFQSAGFLTLMNGLSLSLAVFLSNGFVGQIVVYIFAFTDI